MTHRIYHFSSFRHEIAVLGNGIYAFIPDSSFTGTAFVHATSNLLTTMTKPAKLLLEPQNGASITTVIGGHQFETASWGVQVNLCPLQYGQTKDIVIQMASMPAKGTAYLSATLKYDTKDSSAEVTAEGIATDGGIELDVHRNRLQAIDAISQAATCPLAKAQAIIKDIINKISNSISAAEPRTAALLQDLTGQVTAAFSKSVIYWLFLTC